MNILDFRSDTVTQPTKAMKEAMFTAAVGDDVYGEDTSINALECKAAAIFGKEAALFCPSGTMTNQIAIKVHTSAPGELICHRLSHIYMYEGGGIAFNSGLSTKLLEGNYGKLTVEGIKNAINVDDVHFPETQLVCLENTSNKGGGVCYNLEEIKVISDFCKEKNLPLHLDGARVFNAIVAKGYTASEMGKYFDSISICLSKGLGAPVGSLLVGSHSFIRKARRIRKLLGGGMRQAGYLAAAATYALDHHVERLAEDHQRAAKLAQVIRQKTFVKKMYPVETNLVAFELIDSIDKARFIQALAEKNIKVGPFGPNAIRFALHLQIEDEGLEYLIQVLDNLEFNK